MEMLKDWHLEIQMVKLTLKVTDLVMQMDLWMVTQTDLRLVKRMRLVIVKDWQTD